MAWVQEEEALLISTAEDGLLRWKQGGIPIACAANAPLALAQGPEGLIGAEDLHARIARFSTAGERGAVLATSFEGDGLAAARSLAVHGSGSICIVDQAGQLLCLTPEGQLLSVGLDRPVHFVEIVGDEALVGPVGARSILVLAMDDAGVPGSRPVRSIDLLEPALSLCDLGQDRLLLGGGTLLRLCSDDGTCLQEWRMPDPVVAIDRQLDEGVAYVATGQQVYRLLLP